MDKKDSSLSNEWMDQNVEMQELEEDPLKYASKTVSNTFVFKILQYNYNE